MQIYYKIALFRAPLIIIIIVDRITFLYYDRGNMACNNVGIHTIAIYIWTHMRHTMVRIIIIYALVKFPIDTFQFFWRYCASINNHVAR